MITYFATKQKRNLELGGICEEFMRVNSVKTNMVMNAILTMSSFLFPLITFPYASRILLPTGTGRITFALSIVIYFSMFAQLGIPTYGIRACAKVRDDKEKLSKIVQELLIINGLLCIVVYIAFGISLAVVPRLKRDLALLLIMGVMIGLNAIGVEWLYKALEKYRYITIRSVIFKFIALVFMFIFVHKKEDYLVYGLITIFASSASNIFNFINLRKIIYIKPLGDYCLKQHIRMVLIFFAMSIATTIYTNLDNVMLGFMTNNEQVGFYGAAVKIKNILISVVTSVSSVLLPRTSYYIDKGLKEEFKQLINKTMHFVLLISIPLAIYFIGYAREGIFFLSGDAFFGAILPMQIIMPTIVLCGMTNVIGIQMMIPLGLEKQVLYSEIAGAVVDLILNLVFIPKYGAAGAALGTLVAEIIVWLWQIIVIKKKKMEVYNDISWTKIEIAVSLSALSLLVYKPLPCGNLVKLIISSITFFSIYFIFLLILKNSLAKELIKQIFTMLKRTVYK